MAPTSHPLKRGWSGSAWGLPQLPFPQGLPQECKLMAATTEPTLCAQSIRLGLGVLCHGLCLCVFGLDEQQRGPMPCVPDEV